MNADEPKITLPNVEQFVLNPHQSDPPMMKCGHAANGVHVDRETGAQSPCCIICVGIYAGAYEIADVEPDFEGRMARCHYRVKRNNQAHDFANGEGLVPSSARLAFFNHHPDKAEDEYYCGCWGWD